MILTDRITHQYDVWQGDEKFQRSALNGVSLDVAAGEFVAILGANGSGKSTLAKHLNVLLLPDDGVVKIDGMDTKDEKNLWQIRTTVGMVFQNPDNQIIGTSVEEDVAFGPENKNMESTTIQQKVAESLKAVGLFSKRKASPHKLSGGQKQRVAVAGVLAVDSSCIVLDEPTAMLDPKARQELIDIIRELHAAGKTIILITHHADEVVDADRIILMDGGKVVGSGTPKEIFANPELLKSIKMEVPPVAEMSLALKARGVLDGVTDEPVILHKEELVEVLKKLVRTGASVANSAQSTSGELANNGDSVANSAADKFENADVLLEVKDVNFTYDKGTVNESKALDAVNLSIRAGEFISIIGGSGAGKTTLIKHLNGLLKAESGDILYRGESIYRKGYKLSSLRKEVGLVFQNAENQLFCKTVLDDVAFGPRKMGMTDEEALDAARASLKLVSISEEYFNTDPMDMSGGQKKRVAIAGVLAMNPSILVLDEPTAGLDPGSKDDLYEVISTIVKERGTSVVLVSHEMEDVAKYSDRVVVLANGKIELEGTPLDVFSQVERVRELGADVPTVTDILAELESSGLPIGGLEIELEKAEERIAALAGNGGDR